MFEFQPFAGQSARMNSHRKRNPLPNGERISRSANSVVEFRGYVHGF